MAEKTSLDKDLILDLNFVPDWARKPPAQNQYEEQTENKKYERRNTNRGDFKKKPGKTFRKPYVKKSISEFVELPDVEISFLPEQRHLVGVVKKIKASKRAYPLMDLAAFFLSDSEFHAVKVQARKPDDPEADPVKLYQCNLCGVASTDNGKVLSHLQDAHFDEFFDKEIKESSEAPTGKFVCVAKCVLSGTLLGPTNHHTYHDKLMEVYQSRFSDMPFAEYSQTIEISHDEEDINNWKESCKTITVYKLKNVEEEKEFTWLEAVAYVNEVFAPKHIIKSNKVIIPGTVAKSLQDRGLKVRIRNRWQRESKMPKYLSFALRAAFKHMHLAVFKAGLKEQFISSIAPDYLNPENAVEDIAKVLKYLHDNPGCTRKQMFEALHTSEEEAKTVTASLSWLIEKGHIIEFFNGHLASPLAPKK
ncbi:MAG: hypothetical protein PF692_10610 [Kiritimatiellae bacterium]|jgi:hypothetical protein|nr:hypothetical protein [Kiritimatiellia bacterium]